MLGGSAGRGPSLWVPCFPPAICAGGIIGQTRSDTAIFSYLHWPHSGLFIWVRWGRPAGVAVAMPNPFPVYAEYVNEQQLPLPSCCSASPEMLCENGLK